MVLWSKYLDSKNILPLYIYIAWDSIYHLPWERERERVGKKVDKIKRFGSQTSSLIESIKISSKSDSINATMTNLIS